MKSQKRAARSSCRLQLLQAQLLAAAGIGVASQIPPGLAAAGTRWGQPRCRRQSLALLIL